MAEISKNKPKILIFSLAYAPFIGGAEIAVQEITKHLGGDFEFDLITCNLDGKQKPEERIDNLMVYRVGKGLIGKYLFPWLAYKKALTIFCHPNEVQICRGQIERDPKNNYKIIWSIMANQAGLAALFFKKKFPNVKFLLTLQEGDSLFSIWKKTWYIRPLYKSIYRSADYIQAISTFLAKRAVKYGYQGRITVVPNGVKIEIRNKNLEIENNNQKTILTVSRLVEKNGVADLIKAFNILVTKSISPNTKLLIVGDGPLRPDLEKLTKELNLQDKVVFVGHVVPEKINAYYSQGNIFVRPSLSEGLGNVFLEAMINEVPVIATPVGGISDFLKSGETGWFCEPRNPESVAEKIKYVLDEKNKAEVTRVVANAKKMVIEKYTWEIVAIQMNNIFEKILL